MPDFDFSELVERAMEKPGLQRIRHVVEKELFHYDILFALEREGYLNSLVFHGGTCLRLCYNALRFSEDLDFAGGNDFDSADLKNLASALMDHLNGKYGLEVTVKSPKDRKKASESAIVSVDKWQVSVVTKPGRPDLPRQRIKIEVANVPTHTIELRPLKRNYDFLPDGYDEFLLRVEKKEEIVADKLVAFPMALATHIRYRDIWDLAWLHQQNAALSPDLVEKKIADYSISGFDSALRNALSRIPEIVETDKFKEELMRFLPKNIVDTTLGRDDYSTYLNSVTAELFRKLQRELSNAEPSPDPFSFM